MYQAKHFHQLNEFIRAHLNDLEFTTAAEVPESPVEWVVDQFDGMELSALLGLLYGLILRGADPHDCGRYALDQNLSLPFQGFEQLLYEAVILGMRERGHPSIMVARILEMIAVMADGAVRLIGVQSGPKLPMIRREVARA